MGAGMCGGIVSACRVLSCWFETLGFYWVKKLNLASLHRGQGEPKKEAGHPDGYVGIIGKGTYIQGLFLQPQYK